MASYMRVIEKLERQGKRKHELKQQKAERKKRKEDVTEETTAAGTTEPQQPQVEEQQQQQQQQQQHKITMLTTVDSVASLNNLAVDQQHASSAESPATATTTNSKDYSFVDVSVQPRSTLHLLQRNLSSPSLTSSSPIVTTSPPTVFTQQSQPAPQQQPTKFNPKKHWLKCCSTIDENTSSLSSPPPPSQPPLNVNTAEQRDLEHPLVASCISNSSSFAIAWRHCRRGTTQKATSHALRHRRAFQQHRAAVLAAA